MVTAQSVVGRSAEFKSSQRTGVPDLFGVTSALSGKDSSGAKAVPTPSGSPRGAPVLSPEDVRSAVIAATPSGSAPDLSR